MPAAPRLAAETLTLAHTMGVTGWNVAHRGGATAFALAAVGQCFAQRRFAMNLALLWRLRSLWRTDAAQLDTRALRLALAVDPRVRVAQPALRVALQPAAGAPLLCDLPLALAATQEAPTAPAPHATAWQVLKIDPRARAAVRKLERVLAALAQGGDLTLTASAKTAMPGALRAAFRLRIDLQVQRGADYLTLVPERTVALARA